MNSNLSRVLKLLGWLFFALVVLLLIVIPLLTGLVVNAGKMPVGFFNYLTYIETAQAYSLRTLGILWIFFLGSCFASFLNVVAWRVPRGRGINGSSSCPYCHSKLGFRDNMPVIGWIRNEGRCRTCRLPISPRYLIVEIVLGGIFLLVCGLEILGGGANLPLREIERLRGFEHLVFAPKWDLIQLAIYHLILICSLFTFALIRSERLKVPISVFTTSLIFGVVLPLIWPAMQLVPWPVGVTELMILNRLSIDLILTIALGLIGGLGCGLLIRWIHHPFDHAQERPTNVDQPTWIDDGLGAMVLVGVFLGWQSTISVTLILIGMILADRILFRSRFALPNLAIQVLTATLVHLVFWRCLTWVVIWPSATTQGSILIVWIVVLFGLAICGRKLSDSDRPQKFEQQK